MTVLALPDRSPGATRGITFQHAFAAPAGVVYEAFTRPELVRRWWGTSGLATNCRADVRPGGSFAYESVEAGHRQRHSGTYTVVESERLSYTLACEEELLSLSAVVTVSFLEENDRTYATTTIGYPSSAALDAALERGLEQSTVERFDRLAAFVSALL